MTKRGDQVRKCQCSELCIASSPSLETASIRACSLIETRQIILRLTKPSQTKNLVFTTNIKHSQEIPSSALTGCAYFSLCHWTVLTDLELQNHESKLREPHLALSIQKQSLLKELRIKVNYGKEKVIYF